MPPRLESRELGALGALRALGAPAAVTVLRSARGEPVAPGASAVVEVRSLAERLETACSGPTVPRAAWAVARLKLKVSRVVTVDREASCSVSEGLGVPEALNGWVRTREEVAVLEMRMSACNFPTGLPEKGPELDLGGCSGRAQVASAGWRAGPCLGVVGQRFPRLAVPRSVELVVRVAGSALVVLVAQAVRIVLVVRAVRMTLTAVAVRVRMTPKARAALMAVPVAGVVRAVPVVRVAGVVLEAMAVREVRIVLEVRAVRMAPRVVAVRVAGFVLAVLVAQAVQIAPKALRVQMAPWALVVAVVPSVSDSLVAGAAVPDRSWAAWEAVRE